MKTMMNNNKKAINKLTLSTLKNKTKTLFMFVSIILVTFMIYSIFSIGFSYYDNYQTYNLRSAGTTSQIMMTNLTKKQKNKLNDLDYIKNIGNQHYYGRINFENSYSDSQIVLSNYDDIEWKEDILPTIASFEGNYPTKKNEIALSRWTLNKLGYKNKKIGDYITLNINHQKQRFNISAIFTDYLIGRDQKTKSANVAAATFYFKDHHQEINQIGNIIISNMYAKSHSSLYQVTMVSLKDKHQDADKIMSQLNKDLNLAKNQKLYSFGLLANKTDGLLSIVACAFLAILIVLSGYFIINNIMQLSINNDIYFYGQLKTIGTTPKQIKSIVKKETLFYALLAIPMGLVFASLFSYFLVPYTLRRLISGSAIENIFPCNVSFSPFLFLIVIIYVLLTIWVSSKKPAKIASKISPIEAIRYNGLGNTSYINRSFSIFKKNRILSLAIKNILGNGKRNISVILSLFIGLFSCLTIYSAISKPDYNILFARQQPYSFNIEANNPNNEGKQSDITNKEISKVQSLKEITELKIVKTAYSTVTGSSKFLQKELGKKNSFAKESNHFKATIILLNEDDLSHFSKTNKTDNISFLNGDSIYLLDTSVSRKYIKDSLSIQNNNGELIDYKIENLFKEDSNFLQDAQNYLISDSDHICIYMSEKGLEKLQIDPIYEELKINTKNVNNEKLQEKLLSIFKNCTIAFKSQINTIKQLQPIINCVMFVGILFACILLMLGIFNFINIIIMNINSRKKELATLEAIGMTKKQLYKLLSLEGIIYFVISLVLLTIIGIPLSKMIVSLFQNTLYYFKYHFSFLLYFLINFILFIICLITPRIYYTKTQKNK